MGQIDRRIGGMKLAVVAENFVVGDLRCSVVLVTTLATRE